MLVVKMAGCERQETRHSTLIYYTYSRNSAVIQEHLPMCKKK